MSKVCKLKKLRLHPTTKKLCLKGMTSKEKKSTLTALLRSKTLSHIITYKKTKVRLFLHNGMPAEYVKGGSSNGYVVEYSWYSMYETAFVTIELSEQQKQENKDFKLANSIRKMKNEANSATFSNKFTRLCISADETKSFWENRIGTGGRDGEFLSVQTLAKKIGAECHDFLRAIESKTPYKLERYPVGNLEATIKLLINQEGEFCGFLSMEEKGMLNGHYYLLISDKNFVYYEKD